MKMEQFLLKSFLNIFIITVVMQVVSGSSIAFLRALAEEEAEEEQQQLASDEVEQSNTINDYEIKYPSTNNKKNRQWVKVKLSGAPHSHVLSKGQYYELTCTADGGPAPQIYWISGGNLQRQLDELKRTGLAYDAAIHDSGAAKVESKYVIDCASKRDEGPIHCVAIAGEKVQWESTVILVSDSGNSTRDVSCGSSRPPMITNHASTMLALQGTTVILPCVAIGKPRPYITWETSEGNLITNHLFNPRYKVLATGDLLIDALEWNDMNGYTCIAKSNLGEDRVSTFIYPVQRDERR